MPIKYVAVGKCERCGREFVRPPACTDAVCGCQSATPVPLHPALILPVKLHKRLKRIAGLAHISVEVLVNKLLEVAAEEKLGELKQKESVDLTI